MENKSHAFLAGLFAVVLGLAAAAAFYWLAGRKEESRDYVVVTRHNVTGLNPQAQVRYRGIRVGKVRDIRLDSRDVRDILITIEVGKDVPVTRGTTAKLGYQGLTGLAHVLLEDTGKDPTPLAGEGGEPPRIAMVPSLIQELGDQGTAVLAQAREFLDKANDVLSEGNQKKFTATLANLESGSAELKPALASLNATLAQGKRLLNDDNVRKLSAAAGEAGPLLSEARALVGKLSATTDKLDLAIGEPAAGGASALMPRLNELASDVSATSRQLNRVLKLIEESPQSLVFGAPAPPPGPGEPGFAPPPGRAP